VTLQEATVPPVPLGFDLDAYLRRVGYDGPREPTFETLRSLCQLQPACIPFENIDPFLGRVPDLAIGALQAKVVSRRRGGYCYELNLLLREALLSLGMRVTGLAARVVWMQPLEAPPRARSHMVLKIDLPDQDTGPFIADAGFGGRLLGSPLHFEPGLVQVTAAGRERIVESHGEYVVEAEMPGGWSPRYRFTLGAYLPVDYEPLNWYTATRPGSLFANNLLLERLTPSSRANLLNDRLLEQRHGGPERSRRIETANEFGRVLDEIFDLEAPAAVDEIFDRIPKRLDGPYIPS
jgi:N-hydroxyarylamine O-acetyltransferase